MRLYRSLSHLRGNLLAAVDFETTGVRSGFHEIVQVAVVPLDADLNPLEEVKPFYLHSVAPQHPKRADAEAMAVNGLNLEQLVLEGIPPERAADMFREWFDALNLPPNKRLCPLAHNWAFESSFLDNWIGVREKASIFHAHARDAMILALSINDKMQFAGDGARFENVGLGALTKTLGVVNKNPHNALADCIAEAEVYRALLRLM